MKRDRPRLGRRNLLIVAVAVCTGAAFSVPLLVGGVGRNFTLRTAVALAATHDSFTITSPMQLPAAPQVTIDQGRVEFGRNDQDKTPNSIERLSSLISGTASLVLQQAVLEVAPGRRAAKEPGTLDSPIAPLVSALLGSAFAELYISDSTIRLIGTDQSVVELTAFSADIINQRSGRAKITGGFEFNGRKVGFDATMKPVEERTLQNIGAQVRGWPVALALKSDLFELNADGIVSVTDGLQFLATSSSLKVIDVRQTARWLGAEWPDGPGLASFEASGTLELTPRGISFLDATFRMDGNEATGALGLRLSRQRPSFDGTLAFGRLDLTPYYPQAGQAGSGAANSSSATPGIGPVLPGVNAADYTMRLLDKVDADLRVSAAGVRAPTFSFGKSAASLSLKDGMMLADIAELEISDGSKCGGQLSITGKGSTQRMTLRGKIEAIDIALVTRALWGYPAVSGLGELTVDLSAKGRSLKEIAKTLSGKASVKVPQTGEIGIDVKTLAATARSAPQSGWGAAARSRTAVEGFDADVWLDNGRITSESVVAKTGDARLSVIGGVDLIDAVADISVSIDHLASQSVKGESNEADAPISNAAQAAAASAGVEALASDASGAGQDRKPVGRIVIRGPLASPQIRFSTDPVKPAAAPAAKSATQDGAQAPHQ